MDSEVVMMDREEMIESDMVIVVIMTLVIRAGDVAEARIFTGIEQTGSCTVDDSVYNWISVFYFPFLIFILFSEELPMRGSGLRVSPKGALMKLTHLNSGNRDSAG